MDNFLWRTSLGEVTRIITLEAGACFSGGDCWLIDGDDLANDSLCWIDLLGEYPKESHNSGIEYGSSKMD